MGFLFAVVFGDILPDAGLYGSGWATTLALAGASFALAWSLQGFGSAALGAGGVAGLGFHNLCEGVEIAACSAMSPLAAAAFIAHKVPEGMVSVSLTEGWTMAKRTAWAVGAACLIPLGAWMAIPAAFQAPVAAVASGVVLAAGLKASIRIAKGGLAGTEAWGVPAAAAAAGVAVGVFACVFA
jgi:hypothetical protein